MVTRIDDLVRARRRLAAGVGVTTRENRVLPFVPIDVQIPDRVGVGHPDRLRAALSVDLNRGFVSCSFGAAIGSRFSPYSLTVYNAGYTPAGALYAVQSFASGFNVTDSTGWYDVVCFTGGTILINAVTMAALGIPSAALSWPAIPYVIADSTPGQPYGNSTLNATQKRVFAVGRYAVQSWGGAGVVETLTPTTPRTDQKAMTIGQRVDSAINKAWLGQIYYTGTAWDDNAGAWLFSSAQVHMLLAAAYLTKVSTSGSADQPIATLTNGSPTTPSSSAPVVLPEANVCLVGIGEIGGSSFNAYAYEDYQYVVFPWRTTKKYAIPGNHNVNSTNDNWTGTVSNSVTFAGVGMTYTGNNTVVFSSNSEYFSYPSTTIPLFSSPYSVPGSPYGQMNTSVGSTVIWNSQTTDFVPRSSIGHSFVIPSWSSGSASYVSSDQNGIFSVTTEYGDSIISINFSRHKEIGNQATLTATNPYSGYLSSPYGQIGSSSGMGLASSIKTTVWCDDAHTHGLETTRQNAIISKNSGFVGGEYYENETSGGYAYANRYTTAVTARPTVDMQTLSWTTIDYILHDRTNGVYVSIESSFSGTNNGTATLNVLWKVKTRYDTTSQTIFTKTWTYGATLLGETFISSGKYAVPSPQIRAFFAPLYQEQGSFKGAAYVTLAEESNGATPAHLFNFSIRLRMYDDFSTVNSDNDSNAGVFFVPFNLLEALWCYVISQKSGVDSVRYPKDDMTKFNEVLAGVFTTPIAVNVRDGSTGSWAGPIGGDAVGLYRT